jgi:hypothetical protein
VTDGDPTCSIVPNAALTRRINSSFFDCAVMPEAQQRAVRAYLDGGCWKLIVSGALNPHCVTRWWYDACCPWRRTAQQLIRELR